MLYDFILENRARIIESVRSRVRERSAHPASEAKLEHGIPLFLTQVAEALAPATPTGTGSLFVVRDSSKKIGASAALHGHDLLKNGLTIAQVVHGYGDVCQVVTELASGMKAAISADDFQVFNRCLDDAIAGAVTAYGRERERELAYQGSERLGILAHELRNQLSMAILSFDVIKKGMVGLGGSTGAVHARSLAALQTLVERSLAEVRLEAGMSTLERVSVAEFMEELLVGAAMQADSLGLLLTLNFVHPEIAIDADRQLLASAVSNLIQNAFKFTPTRGSVTLSVAATADRVTINVRDECGGLPEGKAEELFRPFARAGSDRTGLGLGLSIALSAARANAGDLHVRDLPGSGCVFSIALPRVPSPSI
ncbi:MAG TPA: HAMP domain-containing sensor histidine kinase [Polyangiaceae bacterium]|nr:HAMP domain-containing sensor histidine kinase [Polyangiaceae bacterium]